ncbi:MAG TPA: hypothetical protein PKJ68_04965 [Candidatus Woesebacteria bacterium]|nr:hypothetical protein [Candidatus Woesebacteria bacterium]
MNFKNLAAAAIFLSLPMQVLAAEERFDSKATPGSMDEYYRINYIRNCSQLDHAPHIKCTKQSITINGKTGKRFGMFPSSRLPMLSNGTFKHNLAKVWVIDEDEGGGDGNRYFLLRFIPQSPSEIEVGPNGQQWPKYFDVVTDQNLIPLPKVSFGASSEASLWIEKKREDSEKKIKSGEIDNPLMVTDYLHILSDK